MKRFRPLLFLAAAAFPLSQAPRAAQAGGTRIFEVRDDDEFDEGEYDGTARSSAGHVTVGFRTATASMEGVASAFACLAHRGRVLAGTAQPASVVEVRLPRAADRVETEPVASLPGLVVTAMAPLGDGGFLVATAPGGAIHKVDRRGRATPFAMLDARFVWDLAVTKKAVYAATGPSGKLFEIPRGGGSAKVIIDSEEEHLLSLAVVDGTPVAGTSPGAKVLAPGPDAEGVVLEDFSGDEVRALALVGNTLVAAVNDFDEKGVSSAESLEKTVARASLAGRRPTGGARLDKDKTSASFSVRAVDLGPRRDVQRAADAAWTVWMEKKKAFASDLARSPDGRGVLVATSSGGKIFRALGPRDVAMVADLEQALVTSICTADRGNAVATTAGGAAVARLSSTPAAQAVYTSRVFDAKQPARVGRIVLEGRGPLRLRVRTGPSEEPDFRWTGWQQVPLRSGPDGLSGALANLPQRRYLQLEVTLTGPAARLSAIRVFYAPENLPPLLTQVEVEGPEPEDDPSPADPEATIRWKADARDGDELVYEVYARPVGAGDDAWLRLDDPKEPLSKSKWTWHLDSVQEGTYEVRVVASDAPDNGTGRARTDSMVSEPFVVDRSPPKVTGVRRKGRLVVLEAVDARSRIVQVRYRLDEGRLHTASPADGLADDLQETFHLLLPGDLAPGPHRLQVYVQDAAGNLAVHAQVLRIAAGT